MDREFVDLYNRELQVLNDYAEEFAEEYPGIAERLGGIIRDRQDPMISGLLEGAAFLAARVQLKLKHEFFEFASNYLDQLVPGYLAPAPSALLAKVQPPYSDPALREGMPIAKGSYIDATFRERDRRIACRYQLRAGVTLWPFDVKDAEYLGGPGALQALGVPVGRDAASGLRISLTHRTATQLKDEIPDEEAIKQPDTWFAGCRVSELPFYVLGAEADAVAIYEQLFGRLAGAWFRILNEYGDPVLIPLGRNALEPLGLTEEESLLPRDTRVFHGFDLLREYFLFPQKFLGFRIKGLDPIMPQLTAKSVDLVFEFTDANARLASVVSRDAFSLYTAPAINLFEKTMDRITVAPGQHEFHIVPDRSRYLDFEPHRILDVHAHFAGGQAKAPVLPLYSSSGRERGGPQSNLYYTIRRLPRRRSAAERQFGVVSNYTGNDLFIAISEPPEASARAPVAQLSIRALCSNRHLTEQLPVGEGGADFRLLDDTTLDVMCVAGPTPPKGPIVSYLASKDETAHTGTIAWRLVNLLSVNQLGLVERGAGRDGRSLREVLSLFADLSQAATERKVRGIRSVDSRPVVRRIRQAGGAGVARGLEVTVTLEDKAFEGSGAFLLGAILDRFFVEYVAINHFVETVLRTTERGEVMRWGPSGGERVAL